MIISEEYWERHGVDNRKRLSQFQKYFSLGERSIPASIRDF
jgi:hypothetical protein